jgi:hypothetical protein
MTDGLVLPPGAGRMVRGAGMTLKVGDDQSGAWSAFEAEVGPGFDVGAGCPHAFANPGTVPARMLFMVSPPGHEHYLDEIGELVGRGGPRDPAAIAEIRARHDIQQLTPMVVAQPR